MANLNKNFENIQDLLQREFDVNETIALLMNYNTQIFMSWGVERMISISSKGLLMLVNGHHHKGWVLVVLAWNDTYSYYLLEANKTIKTEHHGVYFDMLQDMIDKDIEFIDDYKQ